MSGAVGMDDDTHSRRCSLTMGPWVDGMRQRSLMVGPLKRWLSLATGLWEDDVQVRSLMVGSWKRRQHRD